MPTDPVTEQTDENARRAGHATVALAAYALETGSDDETMLTDLLADLMHWARANGRDFDVAMEQAEGHYAYELEEDGDASV